VELGRHLIAADCSARKDRLASSAQRCDIAVNCPGRDPKRRGEIVHRRLGALSDSLGTQAANANMTLGDFAALETCGLVFGALDRPEHLGELIRPQRAAAWPSTAR
jgi:hypothetical protein